MAASGLMGTISGSATANAASTGMFTIPLMKRLGYTPRFSAAVEAVSSTGGQLMPPVMGSAAFLMAEYLQISYREVAAAALIPAILFYVMLFVTIDLEAAKQGLKGQCPSHTCLPAVFGSESDIAAFENPRRESTSAQASIIFLTRVMFGSFFGSALGVGSAFGFGPVADLDRRFGVTVGAGFEDVFGFAPPPRAARRFAKGASVVNSTAFDLP
jgi:TRAP-type uncharacterized transport system fused permease subunit